MPQLTGLHLYPVKAMHRLSPAGARVEPWGLAGDRRWMLTGADGHCLTQRERPALARYRAEPQPDGRLAITGPDGGRLKVAAPSARAGDPVVEVRVFRSTFKAAEADAGAQAWIAERLPGARLVHLDDPLSRPVDPDHARPGDTVSMADGYPLLVTTTASLDELNARITAEHPGDDRLGTPVPMERFRPNLVVSGTAPWEEDDWHRLRVGEVVFRVVKRCGRCVVTTTDQETGERHGPQPLYTLARHHLLAGKAAFGMNLIPERPEGQAGDVLGTVRLGDEITVLD